MIALAQQNARVMVTGGKSAPISPQLRVWDAEAIDSAITSAQAGYLAPLASLWESISVHDLVRGPLSRRLATTGLPMLCSLPMEWAQQEVATLWADGWRDHAKLTAQVHERRWRATYLGMNVSICHVRHWQENGKLGYRLTHIPPHAYGFDAINGYWYVWLTTGSATMGEKVPCVGSEWWVVQGGDDPKSSIDIGYWRTLSELVYGVRIADSEASLYLRNQAGGKTYISMPGSGEDERSAVVDEVLANRNNSVVAYDGMPGAINTVIGGNGPAESFENRLVGLKQRIAVFLTGISQDGTETVGLGGSSGSRSALLAAQSDQVLNEDAQLFGGIATHHESPLMACLKQRQIPGLNDMSITWDITRSTTVGAQIADQTATLDMIAKARGMNVPVNEPLLLDRVNLQTIQPGAQ